MKKGRITVSALMLACLLAACGTKQAEGPESGIGTESAAETESAKGAESMPETEVAEKTESAPEDEETGEMQQTDTPGAESETEQGTDPQAALKELAGLLGMQDEQTAGLFGGGEENRTEDKSFYIGRIYEVEMGGTVYPVYTSCDENNVVNSVSIWLSDGERSVEQEEALQWARILTDFTQTEPVYDETTSEAGSKNWKWLSDEKIITLNWLDTIFTISMNPAVGELK